MLVLGVFRGAYLLAQLLLLVFEWEVFEFVAVFFDCAVGGMLAGCYEVRFGCLRIPVKCFSLRSRRLQIGRAHV